MKKVSIILLGMITLPTYANIASKEYTDAKFDVVSDAIDLKANKTGYAANGVLQTDTDGKVTATTLKTNMIENGAVTNSKLASGIGLDKLDMGTLPTSGKHIMIWNSATNKYVFEEYIKTLQCSAGTYDIGFAQCIDPETGGDDGGYYSHDGNSKYNETKYGLSAGEWAVEFSSYGVVKGTALCSSTIWDFGVAGTPDESGSGETQFCWCKTTSPAASRWVFFSLDTSAVACAGNCVIACVYNVHADSAFRSGLFGSVVH